MADPQAPQVVVNTPHVTDVTWSPKEVFADLKSDIIHRFDKTDAALDAIDRRLDNAATKEDVTQIHRRIDGVETAVNDRLVPLEQQASDEKAIEASRGRFRTNLAWAAGIAGTCAIIASVIVPQFVH